MKTRQFDVIIVGGRVAGAAAAIEFAKGGQSVLLVDQAKFPSDTLSTHFMNPRGMTYLAALGVVDQVKAITPNFPYLDVAVDDFKLGGYVDSEALKRRLQKVHGSRQFDLQTNYACVRRHTLDDLLIRQAEAVGVAVMTEFKAQTVMLEDGKAVGIRGTPKGGVETELFAKLVVAADGRRSKMAECLGSEKHEEKQACTFACYTYFSGLNLPNGLLKRRNRTAYAAVPTNDGNTMVLVYGPSGFYEEFKKDKETNFFKALALVDPEFHALITSQGKRVEGFYSTDDQSAFMRKPNVFGVPLLGDAALYKDQCTASGMMYGLRDGILLAQEVLPALTGELEMPLALRNFEEKRYMDSQRYYDFTCSQAEMNPVRDDEFELYEAVSRRQEERNNFVSVYYDVAEVREFFSRRNIQRLLRTQESIPRVPREGLTDSVYRNPYLPEGSEFLREHEQTCLDFAQPHGRKFEDRVEGYFNFYKLRLEKNAYQYARTLSSFPGPRTELNDDFGRQITGINFASQDYLGLGQDPELKEAALEALATYGPHSAGSPMIIGNTLITKKLEEELGRLTGKKHVLIFPTGYAAGMGSLLGLVREHDHIVMDRLSHACLQQGANAATRKIHRFAHLDPMSARAVLKSIREKDSRNGILLITEGLFSMDADSPDLKKFQDIASEFDATLFVDVAHDLGASGPGGTGELGRQGMYGKADLIMGSFSKTFATNGGFLATNSEAVLQYVKMYSTPHLFSNALSPVQAAVALRSAQIIQSAKGERLRNQLSNVVQILRDEFRANGMTCLGNPSPIIPVLIGTEREARICHRLSTEYNIANMILEYPVVALGLTRFRLQAMATHTPEDALAAAKLISHIIKEAKVLARPGSGVLSEASLKGASSVAERPNAREGLAASAQKLESSERPSVLSMARS